MIEVDAMGLECPEPVIRAKKAINENTQKDDIFVRVDNEVAVQNLIRLGEKVGAIVQRKDIAAAEFAVQFSFKQGDAQSTDAQESNFKLGEYVVALSSDKVGQGADELGAKLAESFVYALTEQDIKPKIILCYNSGVLLSTKNEKTISDLKKLEASGVEVISCGLCLDYFKLKEELKVGGITNMYRIVEILRSYHVVHP